MRIFQIFGFYSVLRVSKFLRIFLILEIYTNFYTWVFKFFDNFVTAIAVEENFEILSNFRNSAISTNYLKIVQITKFLPISVINHFLNLTILLNL